MGRTTIEVDESVRNRLRTYKNSQGMTYNDAINRLLTTAGEPVGDHRTPVTLQTDTETIYYSDVTTHEPAEMCTFHNGFLRTTCQPVVFGGRGDADLSLETLHDAFKGMAPYLPNGPTSGTFAIRRFGGTWYGNGLGSFYTALENQTRYEQAAGDRPPHSGTAVYLASADWGDVCLGLQLTTTHTIADLTIQFVTDGVPLTQYPYATIAQQLELDLSHAYNHDIERVAVENMSDHSNVDIIETIPDDERRDDDPRLNGLQIKNPFYNDPDRLRALTDTTGDFDAVTAYEYIPCRLVWPYSADDPHEYDITSFSLYRLPALTSGFDIINIDCSAG